MIKRNLPLMITIGVFVLGYLYCLTQFPGFASTRVICNILTDNAFLGIIAVGMTFVILSGGIDLRRFGDRLYRRVSGKSDWRFRPLAAAGVSTGAGDGLCLRRIYGALIDALKIPAFIITPRGCSFARRQLSRFGRVDPDKPSCL